MAAQLAITLVAKGDSLYTKTADIVDDCCKKFYSDDELAILLYHHEHGTETIAWPDPNLDHLRNALFDARETGMIPFVDAVTLPSGRLLFI